MGGPSEERDVSLTTGNAVAEACRRNGYETTEYPFHFDHRKLLDKLKKQDIIFAKYTINPTLIHHQKTRLENSSFRRLELLAAKSPS